MWPFCSLYFNTKTWITHSCHTQFLARVMAQMIMKWWKSYNPLYIIGNKTKLSIAQIILSDFLHSVGKTWKHLNYSNIIPSRCLGNTQLLCWIETSWIRDVCVVLEQKICLTGGSLGGRLANPNPTCWTRQPHEMLNSLNEMCDFSRQSPTHAEVTPAHALNQVCKWEVLSFELHHWIMLNMMNISV